MMEDDRPQLNDPPAVETVAVKEQNVGVEEDKKRTEDREPSKHWGQRDIEEAAQAGTGEHLETKHDCPFLQIDQILN